MTLTPVESSHIAAVGLVEPDGVLLVRYRDGSLYARLGWTAGSFAALLAAPSVGKRLASTTGGSIRLLGGRKEEAENIVRAERAAPLAEDTKPGPLNLIDGDAYRCCRKGLTERLKRDSETPWTCAECGADFVPEAFPDRTRYWRIRPAVAIVRPSR